MEKEIDKKNLVLKEDESIGTVQIADDVVAMIAALAATEVEGVSAMASNITNELMSKVGVKSQTKGVKVEVQDKNVTVDLAVTMEYGYNIPATCQAVQQKVKNAIENMTGLTCSDVNIRIAGVNMKKNYRKILWEDTSRENRFSNFYTAWSFMHRRICRNRSHCSARTTRKFLPGRMRMSLRPASRRSERRFPSLISC